MNHCKEPQKDTFEHYSIKPRLFTLNLSDADFIRINITASKAGTTPEKILESFVGDLVNGTCTNGNDERELANAYFEKRNFKAEKPQTLLSWALENERFEDVDDYYLALEGIKKALRYYELHPISAQENVEHVEYLNRMKKEWEVKLMAIYTEYTSSVDNAQEYDEAFETVDEYITKVTKELWGE